MSQNGKGDLQRPAAVPQKVVETNWERTFGTTKGIFTHDVEDSVDNVEKSVELNTKESSILEDIRYNVNKLISGFK